MRLLSEFRTAVRHGDSLAFTRLDLIAIVSSGLAFAFCGFPALGNSRVAGAATTCLNNHRQIIMASQTYATDNRGVLVQNYHGAQAQGGAAANSPAAAPWACGWEDWGTGPDNTNYLFLRNQKYAKLSPYILSERNVHKCPSDTYLSAGQLQRGWPQRVRSVSMNAGVGDGNAPQGPWYTSYTQVKKISAFAYPGPSEVMVTIDEHPDSINDPLLFPPQPTGWVDVPATYHQLGAAMSFADGHAALHVWSGSLRESVVRVTSLLAPRAQKGDPDINWVNYHTPRSSEASFETP